MNMNNTGFNPNNMAAQENQTVNFNRYEPGYNDANSIQLRLDTEPVKAKIQIYLQGMSEVYQIDPKTNQWGSSIKQIGKPKVNQEGLQTIMMFVENIFNSQLVQGNFEQTRFDQQMCDLRISLANALWVNMQKYDISQDEYDGIVDFLFIQMKIFLTRTINNGERNSYGQSLQIKDTNSNTVNKRKGALSFLFGG